MNAQPDANEFYSYATRQGIKQIAWNDFVGICKGLARAAETYDPQIILGLARGGLYAATFLSHLLRVDVYPIRLTRRQNDRVVFDAPRWFIKPPSEVRDKRVLLVDEICSKGITLQMAIAETNSLGARVVKSAVLYAHTWGAHVPDYIGIVTDELLMNPWDREILQDGNFVLHPEYVHALQQQGIEPTASFYIGVEPRNIAKG